MPSKTKGKKDGTPAIGTCKVVRNPRTKRCTTLCYVGKGESRTGWAFKKGSSKSCST
jgi:hypothetical protein